MQRILMGVAALIAIISAGMAGSSVLERNRNLREIELLRGSIQAARFSADSCRMSLAYQEQELILFDERLDSLRARVQSYESVAQGGVMEEEYPEYLGLFQAYNDSVAAWQPRAEALQASDQACRALIEGHNTLSDSLRRRLEARRNSR
jgi:hypothetical protein